MQNLILNIKFNITDGKGVLQQVPLMSVVQQEGLAVASIARDDPSTLPSDDPFPRAH